MRRKLAPPKQRPASWAVSTTATINGRAVEPGTELSITGERGRHRFIEHVVSDRGTWVTVADPDGAYRSFAPERVKTVHRLSKPKRSAR